MPEGVSKPGQLRTVFLSDQGCCSYSSASRKPLGGCGSPCRPHPPTARPNRKPRLVSSEVRPSQHTSPTPHPGAGPPWATRSGGGDQIPASTTAPRKPTPNYPRQGRRLFLGGDGPPPKIPRPRRLSGGPRALNNRHQGLLFNLRLENSDLAPGRRFSPDPALLGHLTKARRGGQTHIGPKEEMWSAASVSPSSSTEPSPSPPSTNPVGCGLPGPGSPNW